MPDVTGIFDDVIFSKSTVWVLFERKDLAQFMICSNMPQHAWPYIRICSTRKISRCHNLNRPEMEHPHSTNCRQSKQIIMFYQKKSKSTITNNKRTSISNPNKTQIRILLHCFAGVMMSVACIPGCRSLYLF
jgi:hypothetical protein